MSVNEDANNSKTNNSKIKSAIYFSPYAHKKKRLGIYIRNPEKSLFKPIHFLKIKQSKK